MASKFTPPTEDACDTSPSLDLSGRYPRDGLLREAGYEIHARPKDGPALWRCKTSGRILTEKQALREAARKD